MVQERRLKRSALLAALSPELLRQIVALEIHDSLPSTNERLLNGAGALPGEGLAVCLANHQSAGRGRNRKRWRAPPGAGLLLSVSRAGGGPAISSLGLALGVAAAEALEPFLEAPVNLKWPNDLLAGGGKLGGILVESANRTGGSTLVVAGLGVNVEVTEEQRREVAGEGGMTAAGLSDLRLERLLERHVLAAAMITAMAGVLQRHPKDGFGPWEEGWRRRDWLFGRNIKALCGSRTYCGQAAGVDSSGALLVREAGRTRRILSAEIRL